MCVSGHDAVRYEKTCIFMESIGGPATVADRDCPEMALSCAYEGA